MSLASRAGTLTVTVLDRSGEPVPDVAVYAPGAELPPGETPAASATMDQVNERFVPHVLVVRTGTPVEFPNSDPIAHHVYSFSHPNHFKLPMYKGRAHPPVTFQESGVVALGCNIHDQMLGYILVVDTPVFTKTDEFGVAVLNGSNIDPAAVRVWSPRLRDDPDELTLEIDSPGPQPAATVRLTRPLWPPFDAQSEVLSWQEY